MTKPIIIFPLLTWDSVLLHRDQALAKEFAKQGVETYYVDRITRQPWRIFAGGKSKKVDGVSVVSVFALPYFRGRLPFIYKINDALLSWQLRALKAKVSTVTLFVSNPDWANVAIKFKTLNSTITYDISDDYVLLAKNDKWSAIVANHEGKMVESADKFIVTMPALSEKTDPKKPSLIVSNGVDLTGFDTAKPSIARDKYQKVAGFIGGIYEWVDLDLMRALVTNFPEVLFLLVGPTNRKNEITALEKHRNVRYLGAIPKEQIANYFAGLDVGLLPFVSEKQYPRLKTVDSGKVYQYLYFGYPVVSTDYEQARTLREHISVANDENDFLARFKIALTTEKSKTNQEFALHSSWSSRAKQILEFLK